MELYNKQFGNCTLQNPETNHIFECIDGKVINVTDSNDIEYFKLRLFR